MPANLPPEYHRIEAELRAARTAEEKIDIYERLIAVIPHHKGTDKLIAMYRQKIAKAREEGERLASTAKCAATHKIERTGAGQVCLAGPPNAGKSSLVKALTGAAVEVADYPFTTRQPAPFMMPFENVKVQLVDTPPVTGELMETWFPEMVKTADALLLVADLGDPDAAAILDGIAGRLRERRIELVRADADVPPPYFPFRKRTLLAANKIDLEGAPRAFEELEALLDGPFERLAVSALTGRGLEPLRRAVFGLLRVVRVYSKIPGKKAEKDAPFTLRTGSTVMDMARAVHKDFAEKLQYARVWNAASLDGLRVNRDYVLADEDVVELHI
ncbi:MAG TPA: 50S ribosome-binding GTPase [Candidatus Aminicenantes bacterium]|nr:50S ribosome-binding GTPase [Candidatus Aminicenantes bacterium]HRY65096.1 50S ribosome-binding GTPase [Candidatus Aminicenantes bacterium]HRZ72009.1 50S ribosome-binding GTPase [Candidatus Aminicenantes bacterium]